MNIEFTLPLAMINTVIKSLEAMQAGAADAHREILFQAQAQVVALAPSEEQDTGPA